MTVVEMICRHLEVDPVKVVSASRSRPLVAARQICIYIMVFHLKKSRKAAALIMGNRDHTTAIHSIKAVKAHLSAEPEYKINFENILNLLSC